MKAFNTFEGDCHKKYVMLELVEVEVEDMSMKNIPEKLSTEKLDAKLKEVQEKIAAANLVKKEKELNALKLKGKTEVMCINHHPKTNKVHQKIQDIGGFVSSTETWQYTQAEAIDLIEKGEKEFYIKFLNEEHKLTVEITEKSWFKKQYKYLGIEPHNKKIDLLMQMSECSVLPLHTNNYAEME